MSAEDKLARQRLSVLELAEQLGSVREACRQRGVSRTQFYEYKRRFQTHGIEGLKDLLWPPFPKSLSQGGRDLNNTPVFPFPPLWRGGRGQGMGARCITASSTESEVTVPESGDQVTITGPCGNSITVPVPPGRPTRPNK